MSDRVILANVALVLERLASEAREASVLADHFSRHAGEAGTWGLTNEVETCRAEAERHAARASALRASEERIRAGLTY